ncbi:carboxypeptidase-like regulatory domain-containing protein [Nocardioides sp. TF02-7]|uniref:carboxypeptidase-like regulatory domain-containing protein n=1 Tax=Nocardioides sp. TF02-7 TaxID=2917724 RepID=UPI001F0523CF|nr:carboxypeptidase-like regulatory domain-containing protein [Nocardioides sp. TF02-7]UMG91038.1 carboxypeptidase-like regulatory domain-containing protein [Nocardioides sp. TF02-7]
MRSVATLTLAPTAVELTSTLSAEGTPPPYRDVEVAVTSTTTTTTTIKVTADDDGNLLWNDSRYPAGMIRPGSYTMTASADGYVSEPVAFTCVVDAPCSPPGPVLRQLGSLTVNAVDAAGSTQTDVDGVIVTLRKGGQVVETRSSATDGNSVTFPSLLPGAEDYTLRVQAAGYDFDAVTLVCSVPDEPDQESIEVAPGVETVCDARLQRLATVGGTVGGVLAAPSETGPVQLLANARVTITQCTGWSEEAGTPTYCTALSPRRFTTTSGPNGEFELTGTAQAEGINAGVWLVSAEQQGWSARLPAGAPTGARAGTVVVIEESDLGGVVDADPRLHVVPVDYEVTVEDQYAEPLGGVTVRLLRGTTTAATAEEDEEREGVYRFADAIPGTYTLEVTGNGTVRSTAQVTILVGDAEQDYLMPVSRAVNTVSGTVVSADAPSGVAGVAVTIHACPAEGGDCSDAVATGTTGDELRRTTGGNGAFDFRTVPDGVYEVRFSKRGYVAATGGRYTLDHTVGALPSLSVNLARILRNVQVTLTSQPAGTSLDGAQVRLVPAEPDGSALGPQTVAAGTTSFVQVPYGCWDVEVTLPAGHHGDVSVPADPADHPAETCSGDVVIATPTGGAINGNRLAAAVRVAETKVTLRVTAQPLTGHTGPPSATVTVSGVTLADDEVMVGNDDLVVYLAPGDYDVRATATGLGAAAPFWPPSATVEVEVEDEPEEVTLDLEEVPGEVTVSTVLQGTSTAVPAELTLEPGTGQGAAVPAAYADGVDSDGEHDLTLPSGEWRITATTTDGRTRTVTVDVDELAVTASIALPAPPEDPEEPEDP